MTNPWQPDPPDTIPAPPTVPPGSDNPWRTQEASPDLSASAYLGAAYYPYSTSYPGGGVHDATARHAAPAAPAAAGGPGQPGQPTADGGTGAPAPRADPPRTSPHTSRLRLWVALVSAVLAVALAATLGTVAGYRTAADEANANYGPRLAAAQSSASAAHHRADRLSEDLAAARSSLAGYQAAEAEASAEAAEVPDLIELAQVYFDPAADVSGSASAVEITITDASASRDALALSEYLSALGFSDAVLDRMSKTRALDGTLTAQGHHCNVSWTYHPDHGLQMVFEATPGS